MYTDLWHETTPSCHHHSYPLFSLLTLILISGITNSMPWLYYGPSVKSKSHQWLSCVPIWNCLPPHCVLATSSCSFKKSISFITLFHLYFISTVLYFTCPFLSPLFIFGFRHSYYHSASWSHPVPAPWAVYKLSIKKKSIPL